MIRGKNVYWFPVGENWVLFADKLLCCLGQGASPHSPPAHQASC